MSLQKEVREAYWKCQNILEEDIVNPDTKSEMWKTW